MKRLSEVDLKNWQSSPHRKPLLIRGARQIGKTYGVRQFGAGNFSHIVEINFEQQKEYKSCFDTLYPDEILNRLRILSRKQITPGDTLLFLDEIQECPEAILSLRYFYEQMPALHVIGAGSLLEFTLRQEDFRMPVGRIQSLYMYPLSFKEFLLGYGESALVEYLQQVTVQSGVEPVFHERLIALLRQYLTVGGMPEVISAYREQNDLSVCQLIQATILDNYRSDFGKYASRTSIRYLQSLYEKAPGLVGKHFHYVSVDPDALAREIRPALLDLIDAGIIYKVQATSASGLPLSSTINEKKFKLLFVDVGLVSQTSGLGADILMQQDLILVNRGFVAEQFVGQELLAHARNYQKPNLYYWERGKQSSTAEVDYVIQLNSSIIPIEVKSGTTGSLKSLQIFLNEKQLPIGVQISQKPLSFHHRILSIPFYMIAELPRLVAAYI